MPPSEQQAVIAKKAPRDAALDDLLRVMNLPAFMRRTHDGICRTDDGYYLLRPVGSIGYDAFLGRPRPVHPGPALDATRACWAALNEERRTAVRLLAARPVDGTPIPLADFGIGESNTVKGKHHR